MRSNTTALNPTPTPDPRSISFLVRARDIALSLLQRWRDARTARAHRAALAQLDAATLRDLGLDTSALGADTYWPASRWTARHTLERYL